MWCFQRITGTERSFLRTFNWPIVANKRLSKLELDCSTLTLPLSATQAEDEATRARGPVIEKNQTGVHEIHCIEPCGADSLLARPRVAG